MAERYKTYISPSNQITERKQTFKVKFYGREQRLWVDGKPQILGGKLFPLSYYEIQSLTVRTDVETYYLKAKIEYSTLVFSIDLTKIKLDLGKAVFTLRLKEKNGKRWKDIEFNMTNLIPPTANKRKSKK